MSGAWTKAKPGDWWGDALGVGLAGGTPLPISCDLHAGLEWKPRLGVWGLISALFQALDSFFLFLSPDLFPEDFVHVPEFANRNIENTVGLGGAAP